MPSHFSRRTFLRSSAAALAAGAFRLPAQEQRPTFVYVGSYTARGAGIYRYQMNTTTGELTLLGTTGDLADPSFVTIDPSGRYLYAGNEIGNFEGRTNAGSVTSLSIDQTTGNLTILNRQASGGGGPAHVSVDPTGRYVLVANYGGGSVSAIPIQKGGGLGVATSTIVHRGDLGPSRARQDAPHAHMILPDMSGRYILANDLSLDKTFIYRLNAEGVLQASDPDFIAAPPGGGPRHLAFHPNGRLLLILNELNSTLSSFTWDSQRGMAQQVQNISTLPRTYLGSNTTAHVVIAPSGRFAYVSNRGHNSIAVFSLNPETGQLAAIDDVWTAGQTPRNFAIDPTGNFMYVAHQDTDNIVTFRVDQAMGKLTPTGQYTAAGQPVSIAFLTPPLVGNMARDGVTFVANPNPAIFDSNGAATVTLSWNAPDIAEVDLRIGSPGGVSMGKNGSWGSTTTGNWVTEGMTFFLQDASRPLDAANTLATVRVRAYRP